MEYKADVCRVDNSRLSAWRQGGWLAPCNTFHYTAAESAIGHRRGQWWVSPTSADTQHSQADPFPRGHEQMERWERVAVPGTGPGLENAGRYLTYKPWESSSQNSAENLKKYLKLKRFTMENNEEQVLRTPLPLVLVAGVWPRPGEDNVRLCTKFKPQFCTFQM